MKVDPYVVMVISGIVLPLVNGLVFRYSSNPKVLSLANAVLAFVANGIAYALAPDGAYLFDREWLSYLFTSFVSLVIAQTAYLRIYVPLKLTARPDGILPKGGIKIGQRLPAEYPPATRADAA